MRFRHVDVGAVNRVLVTYRRMAVAGVVLAAFLGGVGAADPSGFARTRLLSKAALAVGLALWCATDASLRGRHEVWGMQWQLMTTWPVTIPTYVMQTRKWRSVPFLLGSVMVCVAAAVAGEAIADWVISTAAGGE